MGQIMQTITNLAQVSLDWCYKLTGNYGWAIILFTILFTALLTPTRVASIKQQKLNQLLQPELDEINAKFKGNPEKQNAATQELWKKYGFNPLAGCLPTLLQMPIFFAVLAVFRNINYPEGAASAFFWIQNLAEVDSMRILPILAGGASYLQSWASGLTKDPKQKSTVLMMPLMMTWICWNQPASLGIYWAVSQLAYMAQHLIISPLIKVEPISN
ncbi:MAG: YidC/Oxa1 family membrane protein insertase [Firmicutes bacterium]|nr:YidC/Oxa1 family membrane protein insertase [Bacillota bacterium]